MAKFITYVGLDVHKNTIVIALAEPGKRGEVRECRRFATGQDQIDARPGP